MGGRSGGGVSSRDIAELEEKVRQKLSASTGDGSPHVFISFAYEDVDEVNLLRGQAKNEKTELQFDDYSVKEPYDSVNAEYIKRKIREKIDRCSVTVVYLSEYTASSDWVNWEISESIKRNKGVVGVYTGDKPPPLPQAMKDVPAAQVVRWGHEALVKAIGQAARNR